VIGIGLWIFGGGRSWRYSDLLPILTANVDLHHLGHS
jgi:hypothetical protein